MAPKNQKRSTKMPESQSNLPVPYEPSAPEQKTAEKNPMEALGTDKMRVFVEEYCTGERFGKPFNKTRAAEAAGYAEPSSQGHHVYARPEVKAAIQWRLNQLVMTNEEIVARLNRLATGELGEVVDTSGTYPKYDMEWLKKNKDLIKGFKLDSNGNAVIEFHDPHAALKDLMKVRGMGKEGLEISGPGGGAVPVQLQVNFVAPRRED